MKIIIINGPNLNLLGKREVDIYGNQPFEDYFETLTNKYQEVDLEYYQSNSEGFLINKLHEVGFSYDGIIINGAVVEVASPHAKFVVHNQAAILRGKEILSEEQAVTPATRVYYALQSAYLFPEHSAEYLEQFDEYIEQYLQACPSAKEIATDIAELISDGMLYKALKSAQELVAHQQGVLHEYEEQLAELVKLDIELSDQVDDYEQEIADDTNS